MANGLRSLKYGIGNQTVPNNPITLEDIKKLGLFGLDLISPAYDIQEYKEGVEQTLGGNFYGIPRALTGLLGIAIPGSKYIKKGTEKAVNKIVSTKKPNPKFTEKELKNLGAWLDDPASMKYLKEQQGTRTYPKLPVGKEIKVYHGTDQPYKGEGFRTGTGVLFTSPNSKFVDSFTRSDKIGDLGKYKSGARVYPLRINKNANIFDPTDKKQFNELLKNKRFKAWVKRNNKIYNDGASDIGDVPLTEKQFLKTLQDNEFFETGAASFLEHEDLHPILKDLGFDGFTMREADTTNIGIFLNDKGTSPILKTLDQKKQGGSIRDYYKTYNTQRFI